MTNGASPEETTIGRSGLANSEAARAILSHSGCETTRRYIDVTTPAASSTAGTNEPTASPSRERNNS